MFFKFFQRLNHKKNFPYFICTPLIYGLGKASEHIYIAAAYAKRHDKKIILIKMKEKGWGYTRKTQRKEKEKGCEVAY